MTKFNPSKRLRLLSHEILPYNFRTWLSCKKNCEFAFRTGALFIHIPKNAGTTINHAFYGRSLGHFTATQFYNIHHDKAKSIPTFAITRNPWDRAVSIYEMAKNGGSRHVKMSKAWKYRKIRRMNFDQYISNWLIYKTDLSALDFIFRDQCSFIYDGQKRLITHLGKVEEIDQFYELILRITNIKIKAKKLNSSVHQDYKEYYKNNPKLVDKVAHIYSNDVERLGYEF